MTDLISIRSKDKVSESELSETDGVVWFRDDFPLWGPLAARLSDQQRSLLETVYSKRGIVTDGLTYYLYCDGVASWSQLYSKVAGTELLAITKINAPVNYAGPLSNYYSLLKKVAFPLGKIKPSVCIGTYRLVFKCDYTEEKITVHYRPHNIIIPRGNMDEMYDRILMFVISPITLPSPSQCPYRVDVDASDDVIGRILLPLRYDQKLDFLWRIGRLLVEPVRSPSVIVMFGRDGHEGKSAISKAVDRILADAVEWVSGDLFGSKSVWPDADTVMNLCQKRLLICDECKIADGFNYDTIKKWTSEAPVSMDGRTGYLAQTAIVTSNSIPFYEKAAINNSIGRRLVIYHMQKRMTKQRPVEPNEITNMISLKFMSLAISVANAFSDPPSSLAIALYTFFRKNINKITAGLVHDVGATRLECIPATCAMAIRCGVPPRKLCQAFSAMSPGLVTDTGSGMPYINSIRYQRRSLTKHGIEVVAKRVEANKQYINMQALMERGMEFSYVY